MEIYKQAQRRLPQAVRAPSKWLSMYDDFVLKNASSVSQIESALRSLTYIIPGKKIHFTANDLSVRSRAWLIRGERRAVPRC